MEKYLILLADQEFTETRGEFNDTYYAKASQGTYHLVFESDSGEFYFADGPKFVCEHHHVGGVYLNRKDSTIMLWTSGFLRKKRAIEKFASSKFVAGMNKFRTGKEPFVHWHYIIERRHITITKKKGD